jgi:hypothetical protein
MILELFDLLTEGRLIYAQPRRRKVRLYHSIVTHHLPLFFPESERYLTRLGRSGFPPCSA